MTLDYDKMPSKETEIQKDRTGHSVPNDEIENPIHNQKIKTVASPEEISSDILKLLDDRGIYEIGHYPEQWLCCTFTLLPKKINVRKSEDHRLKLRKCSQK